MKLISGQLELLMGILNQLKRNENSAYLNSTSRGIRNCEKTVKEIADMLTKYANTTVRWAPAENKRWMG